MPNKIQLRRGTAAQWLSVNPVLSDGEIGIETDTRYLKFGDGSTAWASLGYVLGGPTSSPSPPSSPTAPTIGTTTNVTSSGATINWIDNSSNETGFTVQLESPSGAGNWANAAGATNPTAANATSFGATGLTTATEYRPRVKAAGSSDSAYSTGLPFTTLTASPPPPSAPDTRPRYGVGSATAGVSTPATLLAAMTATGSNGSVAATFTVSPSAGQYGWFACLASASTSGVTFTDALGTGGWQGASSSGNNTGDDGGSPNTSVVTYSDGATIWRFFRQSYAGAVNTQTTS